MENFNKIPEEEQRIYVEVYTIFGLLWQPESYASKTTAAKPSYIEQFELKGFYLIFFKVVLYSVSLYVWIFFVKREMTAAGY